MADGCRDENGGVRLYTEDTRPRWVKKNRAEFGSRCACDGLTSPAWNPRLPVRARPSWRRRQTGHDQRYRETRRARATEQRAQVVSEVRADERGWVQAHSETLIRESRMALVQRRGVDWAWRENWASRGVEFGPGAKKWSLPPFLFISVSIFFPVFSYFQIPKLNSNSCLKFQFTVLTKIMLLLLEISSSHYLILAMVNDFNTIPFLFSTWFHNLNSKNLLWVFPFILNMQIQILV